VAAALAAGVAGVFVAFDAGARSRHRRFEPTDLELQTPGVAELDLQFGVTHSEGSGGNRLTMPDFELSLGLLHNLEFDLEGTFSLQGFDQAQPSLAGDPLWPSVKLGLYDARDDDADSTFAVGLQLGPRVPTIGARGLGYAALALVGFGSPRTHVTLNAGGGVDPGDAITSGQSKSVVGGVDVGLDLDAKGTWSLLGELEVAHYASADPDELAATFGPSWSVSPYLDLSAIALVGFLPGGDRVAALVGCSPKVPLW
jgi:hypothetical protein